MTINEQLRDDMERKFPDHYLECSVCGRTEPNDWNYLSRGWPKCHDLTMRLVRPERTP